MTDFEHLSESTCYQLLRDSSFGRVAFVGDGRPQIMPVNSTFFDGCVLIWTSEGMKLREMPMRAAAFEIDDVDADGRWGWSVVAEGRAFNITDTLDEPSSARRTRRADSPAPGEKPYCIQIVVRSVSGRAFGLQPQHGDRAMVEVTQ